MNTSTPQFATSLLVLLVLALSCKGPIQAQSLSYNILKGGDVIGTIQAKRLVKGDRVFYSMVSYSSFNTIWNNTLQSTTATEYRNDTMFDCGAFMHLNDNMRDSSKMVRLGDQAHCYVHPNKRFLHMGPVTWTTARMYYEEPIDQDQVFVESEMAYCKLISRGNGFYDLLLSEGKVNQYVYRSGILYEILVKRSLVDLVFRRV